MRHVHNIRPVATVEALAKLPFQGFHLLYRQKFTIFRADGTKRLLFGNERYLQKVKNIITGGASSIILP